MAASLSGRRAHLLEKDIWVVLVLRALMESPFGRDLTFKGGTSLAKAYRAIRRFSEDLDVTYDIRAIAQIAPDLVEGHGEEALPSTSQPGAEMDQGNPGTLVQLGGNPCTAHYQG